MSCRRGFTLLETVMAMAAMLIIGGAVFKLLVTTQRLTRGQAERVALQSSVRAGAILVLNELRQLSGVTGGTADQNDILSAAPHAITYRGMRGLGFMCDSPTETEIRLARNGFSGYRDPQPGRDGAYVFVDGQSDTRLDDSWIPLAITGVATGSVCPGTAGPAITLTVSAAPALSGAGTGTPVRIFEIMELRLYRSQGRSWLGARSVSAGESIQPAVGPLSDGYGLVLDYLDASGGPTHDVTAIKSIRVTLRGLGEHLVHRGAGEGDPIRPQEELVSQVALRNALLP